MIGLRENKRGDTTDVALLDEITWRQRWAEYQDDNSPFARVDQIDVQK
jgi:hypothetical protein